MEGTLLQLILHAGLLVKLVLLVLVFFSILSWSIIFAKYFSLTAAHNQSEAFLRAVETTTDPRALLSTAGTLPASPLANVFKAVCEERGRAPRHEVSASFRRHQAREEEKLHATMIFLATTGSTTPFIGLLGTVWGIMDAFRGIGAAGSASLAVVAPAIAEALVTTAAGLGVAIPAVIAYNYYLNEIRKLSARLEDFSADLPGLLAKAAP